LIEPNVNKFVINKCVNVYAKNLIRMQLTKQALAMM